MDNKAKQRQRMMSYFIDAAKEIIEAEGVKAVSARRVGEKAGYSYATIYNYFKDLNTLLAYCALKYLEECYDFMVSHKAEDCREQLKAHSAAYFEYFTQNPELFQLIFLEDLGSAPAELMAGSPKPLLVGQLLKENLEECARQGYVKEEDIQILQDLIGSSIHGKLLFFMKGRNMEQLEEMLCSINKEIDLLLKLEGN